jgi:VanZ family protein
LSGVCRASFDCGETSSDQLLKTMLRRLGLLSFLVVAAVIAFATLAPVELRPRTGHVHFERIFAYLLLGGSLSLAFPRKPALVVGALIILACGLEYAQTFIPTRDGRIPDAVEKCVGAVIGAAMGLGVTRFCEKRRWLT